MNAHSDTTAIGARLREERTRLGFNQVQMSEAGGVKGRAQIYYEKGERNPDVMYMARISRLGADVQYILTGKRSGARQGGVALGKEEERILSAWRELTDRQRDLLRSLIEEFANSRKPED